MQVGKQSDGGGARSSFPEALGLKAVFSSTVGRFLRSSRCRRYQELGSSSFAVSVSGKHIVTRSAATVVVYYR